MPDGLFVLTLLTALGSGLVAGFFFAFSILVMPALGRVPAAEGARAMQEINIVAINPWLMTALFGTAVLAAATMTVSVFEWNDAFAPYLLAGGIAYLIGAPGVTMAANVPRNNELAEVDPESADGQAVWARYLKEWTAWNHVRTVVPFAATALFAIALYAA
jgi:uncharacterized membrane protein